MKPPYRILIPTFNRPHLIQEATLAYLDRSHVEPEQVDIWVSGESQWPLYEELPERWRARLRVGARGLMANRLAAEFSDEYAEGDQLLWLNDDVYSVRTPDRNSILTEVPIQEVANRGFSLAKQSDCYLWGVYAVNNAFFMSPKDHLDLRYVVGCFYGIRLRKLKFLQPMFGDAKEDYERAMRFYQFDDRILRMDRYAPNTIYYNSPEIFPNNDVIENNIKSLERSWPTWVKRNTKRKSKYPEIIIHDPLRRTRLDPDVHLNDRGTKGGEEESAIG